jgi:hypothetical protein
VNLSSVFLVQLPNFYLSFSLLFIIIIIIIIDLTESGLHFICAILFTFLRMTRESGNSLVGLANGLTTEGARFDSQKQDSFLCSPYHPDRIWCSPTFLFSGFRAVLFPAINRRMLVGDCSPSSSELRNVWGCTSTLPSPLPPPAFMA